MSIGRDLWLGGGVLCGALAAAALRGLWTEDASEDASENGDDERKDDRALRARQLLTSPGPVIAATGLSRQAADILKVEEEQRGGLFATGFGVGMLLMLLSGPLRRFLPF